MNCINRTYWEHSKRNRVTSKAGLLFRSGDVVFCVIYPSSWVNPLLGKMLLFVSGSLSNFPDCQRQVIYIPDTLRDSAYLLISIITLRIK